ncbi:MAG TPA: ribosome-binding factor A [Acidimicrobiales bacterium]|nr:ribosome-binding factor A [Acidimicrobiales bacterium]
MERSRRRPAHPYPRMARVNALFHEVLAEELTRLGDGDERVRLLTITEVLCDPDLRHARVLFASLPDEAAEALGEMRRQLQGALSRNVHMKRIPLLAFAADPAVEAGNRVEEALRRAHRQEGAGDG